MIEATSNSLLIVDKVNQWLSFMRSHYFYVLRVNGSITVERFFPIILLEVMSCAGAVTGKSLRIAA